MTAPDVSIVTAAYNSAEYIERALESVRRQTVGTDRIEHIVVDDGSTDETASIVESFEAPYLRLVENEENSGNGTVACNRGIERARGEYVVVLDSDDAFLPSLVERSFDAFSTREEVDFVYTDYYERFPDGERELVETGGDITKTVKVGTMHRTDRLEEFGLYNPEMIFAEYDLLFRYLDAGLAGYHVSEPLFVYHRRRNSQTDDSTRVEAGKSELREKFGENVRIRAYDF
ncbi:glycosyltransferase (plasmid) [Haladaptatus sp. SPP-AMP-3]|uniref:glycosyltransferase n=1 Tax=Haladaptatus sp. SPP-AMP-3 TaxID=3121295 RepID=UPI003C2D9044